MWNEKDVPELFSSSFDLFKRNLKLCVTIKLSSQGKTGENSANDPIPAIQQISDACEKFVRFFMILFSITLT